MEIEQQRSLLGRQIELCHPPVAEIILRPDGGSRTQWLKEQLLPRCCVAWDYEILLVAACMEIGMFKLPERRGDKFSVGPSMR